MVSTNLRDWLLTSAAAHAERPALWVDDNFVTYRDLIEQGLGIANVLKDIVTRRTAVLADRHLTSYVGIVGAVLAGHAYVPLNPHHPTDRLRSILHRADVSALVISSRALETFRPLVVEAAPMVIVIPDGEAPGWRQTAWQHEFIGQRDLPADRCEVTISPEDGAYLLFTSGSTGEPKGVMVRHRNVMAYLANIAERYDLSPDHRMTQLFDLTFDLSVHDLFVTWGAGATLYCPQDGSRKAPFKFIRDHALTHWFSTPSTVAYMDRLRMLRADSFPSLQVTLFCGEALPTALATKWRQAAPNAVIDNLYGPTEATIAFTVFRLPDDLANLPDIVPIGVPFIDQAFMISGDDELLLSGSQVTEGYWNQPDLTAERYVDRLGRRWYRTGDRVGGSRHGLNYQGRLDRQVKIMGNRVELFEVESVLRMAAGCDSVAAIAWPVRDGMAQGIVGVVPQEATISDETILFGCRQRLPGYMVPARLVRLPEWPLNSNGKTDYSALSAILETGGV